MLHQQQQDNKPQLQQQLNQQPQPEVFQPPSPPPSRPSMWIVGAKAGPGQR